MLFRSVTALTDTSGGVVQEYDYDAFGNETTGAEYLPGDNPFMYCGEYWDAFNKTYYLRARHYDPRIGRFIAEDMHWNPSNMIYGDNPVKWNERPINPNDSLGLTTYTYTPNITVIIQSGNLYLYCGNNPVTFIDPSGHQYTDHSQPLNDSFLYDPDGKPLTARELDDLYKNTKDPKIRKKITAQQKYLKQRNIDKRKGKHFSYNDFEFGMVVVYGVGVISYAAVGAIGNAGGGGGAGRIEQIMQ